MAVSGIAMMAAATRPEFWQSKFDANVTRDVTVRDELTQAGWRVATIWECALRKADQVEAATELLITWFYSDGVVIEVGEKEVSGDFTGCEFDNGEQ